MRSVSFPRLYCIIVVFYGTFTVQENTYCVLEHILQDRRLTLSFYIPSLYKRHKHNQQWKYFGIDPAGWNPQTQLFGLWFGRRGGTPSTRQYDQDFGSLDAQRWTIGRTINGRHLQWITGVGI